MIKPAKVGIVGCGNISEVYFNAGKTFDILNIVACADLVLSRAKAKAAQHGIPKALTVARLLAEREIEIVINLTIPKAHGEVALAALRAGKCVHNEKPLAITRDEGLAILALAKEKNLLAGCAPDTFMGAGIQTCRKLIDDGWIGEPIAANAFMMCHGHENWHPDPDFYYQPGGGPMFDMGPYYLTALIALMGPIKRVCGSARVTFPERLVTSEPKYGTKIQVNTPTHIAGVMDFASGAVATIVTSFDVWAHNLPCIEIHGTRGSLSVPDPNGFGGAVKLRRAGDSEWREVPHSHGYAGQSRGIGVADMAYALRSGRNHRANGAMAYHVLDVMQAFIDSSASNKHIAIKSTCARPAALPLGLSERELDV